VSGDGKWEGYPEFVGGEGKDAKGLFNTSEQESKKGRRRALSGGYSRSALVSWGGGEARVHQGGGTSWGKRRKSLRAIEEKK